MATKHRTYCRLCEAGCGIVVDVADDGTVEKVRPDNDHPVTKGFACNKGMMCGEIHHDPSRLNEPQRRTADGFVASTWNDATTDIAERINVIIAAGVIRGEVILFLVHLSHKLGELLNDLLVHFFEFLTA